MVQGKCQASGVLGQETSPLGQSLKGRSIAVGGQRWGEEFLSSKRHPLGLLVLGAPPQGAHMRNLPIKFREGTFEGVRLQAVSTLPRTQRDLRSHQPSDSQTWCLGLEPLARLAVTKAESEMGFLEIPGEKTGMSSQSTKEEGESPMVSHNRDTGSWHLWCRGRNTASNKRGVV